MYLEIETDETFTDDFPKKEQSGRWYIKRQPALMHVDYSKYPLQFDLTLSFSDDPEEGNKVSAIAKGKYMLNDRAYSFDRNGRVQVDMTKLKAVPVSKAA